MVELALNAFVIVIILLALVVAGCTAGHTAHNTPVERDRLSVQRIYDSPNGPDLYRVKGPNGTTYHRQSYQSPLHSDVASCDRRP